ncbi:hypothetical protein ACT3CE_17520 [Marinifilum sp. RC60d5]|uniref:hypothetical protein n=1 Tax=Marinifilum sp. RC60d5 TaxID=3458414 RepID=UPI004037274B
MQQKSLDNIFSKQLKNQDKVPSNVSFRKDSIFASLENRLAKKSTRKWKLAVAILILLLGSSGYFHYQQYCIINSQGSELTNQTNFISMLENENENIEIKNRALLDSISKSNLVRLEQVKCEPLPKLPTIVINQPIVFQNNVEDKLYIHISERVKLKETESEIPELDLPVYYESNRLANNSEASIDNKSFAKKINKLFKD